MKPLAVAIVASFLFPVHSLAQETTWHAEGHDSLLVAPDARNVKYVRGVLDTLRYTVDVPYPARDVVTAICSDLQKKGWQAKAGCSAQDPSWLHAPGGGAPHGLNLFLVSPNGDEVDYSFNYYNPAAGERTPQILYVGAQYTPHGALPTPTETHGPSAVQLIVFRVAVYLVGFGFILATVIALRSRRLKSVVFYAGPDSWATWTSLVFFGPVAAAFFALYLLFVLQTFGKGGAGASIAAGIAGVALMWMLGKISFVICALLLFLTFKTLSAETIPGKVKEVHCFFNLGSLVFYGFCGYLAYFAHQPLMHW